MTAINGYIPDGLTRKSVAVSQSDLVSRNNAEVLIEHPSDWFPNIKGQVADLAVREALQRLREDALRQDQAIKAIAAPSPAPTPVPATPVSNGLSLVTTAIDYPLSNQNDALLADTTTGNVTVLLHSPVTAVVKIYYIKNVGTGANTLTISGNGVNIDAAATATTTTPQVAFRLLPDALSKTWKLL